MEERNEVILRTVRELLDQGKLAVAVTLLNGMHPADAAEVMENLSRQERIAIFQSWEVEGSSEALEELPDEDQVEVVKGLSPRLARELVQEMSPDDAADLLGQLPQKMREGILAEMPAERAQALRRLLSHAHRTAGGLMTPNLLAMPQGLKVGQVLERLREASPETETVYYVYFLDDEGRLAGVASLRELIVADPGKPAAEVMRRDPMTVTPEVDQEEVAQLIDRYDLLAVPVVDQGKRLLGIVTVDDAMEVIEEEAKEDLYLLAGSYETEEERERRPVLAGIKGRLPWLAVALCLELLLLGSVLEANAGFLKEHLSLVFFLPAVMLLGGTASALSSTRVIREAQEGEGGTPSPAGALAREVMAGLLLGAAAGLPLGLFSLLLQGEAETAWAVGFSCLGAVLLSSCLGSLLPLALKRLGRDPARASEPLVAACVDVFSVALFLAIGYLMLGG
jgi:magnesium transporter